jgi:hypothetical protein
MCWLTRENLAQMTEVSVAGCLGYDVLVSLIFFFLYLNNQQLKHVNPNPDGMHTMLPAHHNLNNQQLKQGYDVLESEAEKDHD